MVYKIKKNLQTNQSGFSMIEMLIVLTVVILISIGFFYKFRINKEVVTELAAKEIVYSIREVKQKILSGDFNKIDTNKDCLNGKCILGINFLGGKTYRVFIERDNPPDYIFNQGDIILEEKNLPQGVSYLTDDFRNVFFEPPYGNFQASGVNGALTSCLQGCLLKVVSDDGDKEINIKLNSHGLVYVE
jgi:prepilin-type N-terminal cleavage/methylation domain-containing protein